MVNNFHLNWNLLLCPIRIENTKHHLSIYKNPFTDDSIKIIFSHHFSILSRKCQVHSLLVDNVLRNRLVHSLEVASICKKLGLIVGSRLLHKSYLKSVHFREHNKVDTINALLPKFISEIVYSACLAHDIGNPPFGHAGEEAIRTWFSSKNNVQYLRLIDKVCRKDFTMFDGNAQSFRVINKLESYSREGVGLQLTYPTISSMIKYPWSSYRVKTSEKAGKKYGFHMSEISKFHEVFETLGLINPHGEYIRHPLSFLVEAADDICYSVMDLEEAYRLKLISFDDFISIYSEIGIINNITSDTSLSQNTIIKYTRTSVINFFIKQVAKIFFKKYNKIMTGQFMGNLINELPRQYNQIKKAKKYAHKYVYGKKLNVELKSNVQNTYNALLDTFIPACATFYLSEQENKAIEQNKIIEYLFNEKILQPDANLYEAYMRTIDHITSSTDVHLEHMYKQFS